MLVTTRNASFARRFNISNSHALEPVDIATGCDIMNSTLKLTAADADSQKKTIEDLCEALGRLPLALSQIAGFIVESGCEIADFWEMYQEEQNLSQIHAASTPGSTMAYNKTISTVWTLSISGLQSSSDSIGLLDMLAFLDPDGWWCKLVPRFYCADW